MLLRKDKKLREDLVEILAMRPAPQSIDELLQQVLYKRQRISMIIVISRSTRIQLERLKRNIENLISFDPSLNAFGGLSIVSPQTTEEETFIDQTLRREYISRIRRKRFIAISLTLGIVLTALSLYSKYR